MTTTTPELTDRIKAANAVARGHFGVFQWPTVVVSTVLITIQLAAFAASLGGPLPLLVALGLAAVIQYPAYICYHEAAHGNIGQGRAKVVNEAVGTMLAVVLGVPLVAHRKEHLAHHAYTNRAGADPDRVAFTNGRFGIHSSLVLLAQQYRFFVSETWGTASRGERTRFGVETAAILGVRIALVAAFGWPAAGLVVFTPLLGVALIAYLVVYLVHSVPAPLPEGRWIDTVSYETEHLPRPLQHMVNWGWMGHHVHGIHHLYPKIPFYRQQVVFQEIRDLMIDLDAPVRRLWPRFR